MTEEKERFKNATKAHLIGHIKTLEKEIEEIKQQRTWDEMQGQYYRGKVEGYETVMELIKKQLEEKILAETHVLRIGLETTQNEG